MPYSSLIIFVIIRAIRGKNIEEETTNDTKGNTNRKDNKNNKDSFENIRAIRGKKTEDAHG